MYLWSLGFINLHKTNNFSLGPVKIGLHWYPLGGGSEMRRSVVAFPPKPRAGGSLTALSGHRLLLFGGRSGRENKCLADVSLGFVGVWVMKLSLTQKQEGYWGILIATSWGVVIISFFVLHRVALKSQFSSQ